MRLCTFSTDASSRHVGLALPDQRLLDVSAAFPGDPRFSTLLDVIQHEDDTLPMLRALLASTQMPTGCLHDLKDVRIELPYQPPQIRCFSVYEQHLKNAFRQVAANVSPSTGAPAWAMQIPAAFYETPVYYKGVRLNLSGPGAPVHRPAPGTMLDYEAELAVVVGRGGKNIDASAAMAHVFGYVVFNDFSERAQHLHELRSGVGTGPAKGKDFDGSNSLGPWIVTADEIPDPHALDVTVRVNGQLRGQGSTSGMTHRIDRILSFASQNETLHAGELLATGCVPECAGVEHWRFLDDGDRVEVEIAGLGVLENTVVAA